MNFEYRIARKIAKNNDITVEEVKLQFLGKLERNIDNYIINTELEQYTKNNDQ